MGNLRLEPDFGQQIDSSINRSVVQAARLLQPREEHPPSKSGCRLRAEHPAAAVDPVANPSAETIYAQRGFIVGLLVALGVPSRDVEDVVQECILGAWRAVHAGRFRPDPSAPPRVAL